MSRILLALILSFFLAGTSFAEMYKWVDKDGKVHYGDCPPPDCEPEQIKSAPAPSQEEIQRSRERAEKLIQDQKKKDEARKLEREIKLKKDEQIKAALKKRCKVLQSRLFLLKQPGVITFADDEGNLRRPSDVARENMISEIEIFIRENCE